MTTKDYSSFRSLSEFSLADLEGVRLLLRGGSVIDWHRLNFADPKEASEFIEAQELSLQREGDEERCEQIKQAAIEYLRRTFEFPVPKPVANKPIIDLLLLASSKGHRQLCACAILKVMHIIHHVEARELLFLLPTSDEEVFRLVEQKVYHVMGSALASGFPIVEFIGGRKNRDSLFTKLLSKPDVSAAQIYDKVRFRIVTQSKADVLPVLNHLQRFVFPFNFVIPRQSTNTLIDFRRYCEAQEPLRPIFPKLQLPPDLEDTTTPLDNRFSAPNYRVVHFVVDMPIRVPDHLIQQAPAAASKLGNVIFVQTEFQVLDEATDRANEMGEASHASYKQRQRMEVMRRLEVGKPSD